VYLKDTVSKPKGILPHVRAVLEGFEKGGI